MFSRVMMAIMAVGPMAGSLQLPSTVYTKHAMNDEYRPIWKQRKILCLIKRSYNGGNTLLIRR